MTTTSTKIEIEIEEQFELAALLNDRRREDFGELVEVPVEPSEHGERRFCRRATDPSSYLPSKEEVVQVIKSLPQTGLIEFAGKCDRFCDDLLLKLPAHYQVFLCGSFDDSRMHVYLLIRVEGGYLYADPTIQQYIPHYSGTFVGTKAELKSLIFDLRTELNPQTCGADRQRFFQRAYGESALDYNTGRTIEVEEAV